MFSKVKINVIGNIISGKEKGFYVKVVHDCEPHKEPEENGGYLILTFEKLEKGGIGFDNWFEKEEDLQDYFDESKWVVEWL